MRRLFAHQGERHMSGLLSGLSDPEFMKRIEEYNRLVRRIADQMGVSRDVARRALFNFEATTSSDGHAVH
jgi:hypothetical protein